MNHSRIFSFTFASVCVPHLSFVSEHKSAAWPGNSRQYRSNLKEVLYSNYSNEYEGQERGLVSRKYGEKCLTIASCRPMFPTVTPPEKNIQGSHERTYKKSGDVYLRNIKRKAMRGRNTHSDIYKNLMTKHVIEIQKWACDSAVTG